MIGIYKITSPTKRIYIGQSIDINMRFKYYKYLKCKDQKKIYNSLKKYGYENHILEVIEECEHSELNNRERYWQDFYNVLNGGLNCVLTSTETLPCIMSEETKQKISKTRIENKSSKGKNNPNYGKTHSSETRKKISDSQLGKKHSAETIKKISIGNKGKLLGSVFSEEHCRKISESRKGFKQSEETKQKISFAFKGSKHPRAKIILDTQTGVFYHCVFEASEAYGIKKTTLTSWLNGRYLNKSNLIYTEDTQAILITKNCVITA